MPRPQHLDVDDDDLIAAALNADVYGGILSDREIFERLVANIHCATRHRFAESGVIPVGVVARLVKGVWDHMDRDAPDG